MCLVQILIKQICSPVNVSATQNDISHLLQIVKPTHIATIAPKLDDIQAALASNSMTRIKVATVLSKVENLPQVSEDTISQEIHLRTPSIGSSYLHAVVSK